MIYTLTVNPSLDYMIQLMQFRPGEVNRSCSERIQAGGKGINVSLMLKNLGVQSCALGFAGGFTGMEIERQLRQKNIRTDFVELKNGISRINVKLHSEEESEINAVGPAIEKDEIDAMMQKLDSLERDDILVLAGSIPRSLPVDFYAQIMHRLEEKKVRFVVDAEKQVLTDSLRYRPFLIKPNNFELGQIFGMTLETRSEVIPLALRMHDMGAQNVLVSLAGLGAVLVDSDGRVFEHDAPRGHVLNSVGAGDSMVAGFVAEYIESGDAGRAFLRGISAGSASAFCDGFAAKEAVDALFDSMLE